MNLTVSPHVLKAISDAYEQAHPGPARPEAAAITTRIIANGWAGLIEIESLLVATEPRLWRLKTRDLVEALGGVPQLVFERPTRATRDAEGIERVSAVDLARVLILLERAGLAVDPMPLCKGLASTIAAKRLLTASELMVHWRAQGVPAENLTLLSKMGEGRRRGPSYAMPSGHRAQIYFVEAPEGAPSDLSGERPCAVSMVTIDPPQTRQNGKAPRLAASA